MRDRFSVFAVLGAVIAAICCFTPVLPLVLPAIGLGGILGAVYSDAVLLPVLAGFLGLTGYAIWRKRRQ